MILQNEKYLESYYGVYREIIFLPESNEIIIYFNAFLNDDLNIKYTKKYDTKEDALKEVNSFLIHDKTEGASDIEYSEKSVTIINNSIRKFLKAIMDNQVDLPSKDYKFDGDTNHIKDLIEKGVDFVFFT